MIEIIDSIKKVEEQDNLPFVFSKEFKSYCSKKETDVYICFERTRNIYLNYIISSSRFLNILTITHPPVRIGSEIDNEDENTFLKIYRFCDNK